MQEFLANGVVNCNLMSLTGYRTLVILDLLMKTPMSNDEINEYFLNHKHIKEKFSNDTLRMYINSLREIGCEISRADKANGLKYKLISHPFTFDITKTQLEALSKLYKNSYDKMEIEDVINLENFLTKLSTLIENEKTKNFLLNILLLKSIDKSLLNELLIHCKKKNQIIFTYNSPKSGPKAIELVADKISFKSNKLYIWGNSLTHGQYSYFSISRIININSIKLKKENPKEIFPQTKIIYEMLNQNEIYIPSPDEKILEKTKDRLVIEMTSQNEFDAIQRILRKAQNCKIISPQNFKSHLITKLKSMRENYENF